MPKLKKTKVPSAVQKPFSKHPPKKATIKKPKVASVKVEVLAPPKYEGDSKRPIHEIMTDRVQYLGEVGVKLSDDIQLGEVGPILDHFQGYQRHFGFMVGDIIKQSLDKFGDSFKFAMQQTGRALSTVKGYLTTVNAFPVKQRFPELDFSHHQIVTRLEPEQRKEILTLAWKGEDGKASEPMPASKLKALLKVKFPRKAKAATPPKSARLSKSAMTLYDMKPSECAAYDRVIEAASALSAILEEPVEKDGDSWQKLFKKLTPKVREGFCDLLKPAAKLYAVLK